jgi:hypothetical protein
MGHERITGDICCIHVLHTVQRTKATDDECIAIYSPFVLQPTPCVWL